MSSFPSVGRPEADPLSLGAAGRGFPRIGAFDPARALSRRTDGLVNMGNFCYGLATLQVLQHTPELVDCFVRQGLHPRNRCEWQRLSLGVASAAVRTIAESDLRNYRWAREVLRQLLVHRAPSSGANFVSQGRGGDESQPHG